MIGLKVYYIYHSCFLVETENYLIIFDYFKNSNKSIDNGISLIEKIFNSDKKILVFSSHSHYDHYNKEIFSWKNKNREIEYILSDDIVPQDTTKKYHLVKEDEEIKIDKVKIKTYGSTDLGVSFLVEIDKMKIFHAGDLNWWYWKDDTESEEKHMRDLYQMIVSKISIDRDIDVAFFPVDPRLEEFCYLGGEYFAENVKPKVMIPMHFDNAFYVTGEFKEKVLKFGVRGIVIEKENSLLNI